MRLNPVNQRLRIHAVQAAALAAAAMLLLVQPRLHGEWHELIEMTGVGLVLVCIAGRMWSILYVGSKKNLELVTSGPYSLTRNPLYFCSMLGAAGIGLMQGSVIVALALAALTYAIFAITAAKEADYLRTVFGARYDAYAAETPMFWPKLSGYRDAPEIAFSPRALRRTFLDGLVFLAAFPAIEAIEHLQAAGYLPVIASIF
ncbi:MAG TPA: isoprenylcysteine carboxylmethyltransferase family protein [Rhizobiaceae bacterium]|nr:isoprenylcysteine carboxylmethyltransferase family protein [Rhizobiaceae bacterium]